jgi:hypothetical protein
MDFLSSLVERALDRMPVLERRRPSLFEPSTAMMHPSGLHSESSDLEIEQEIVYEEGRSERERGLVESGPTKLNADTESIRPASPLFDRENARMHVEPHASITPAILSEKDARAQEHQASPSSSHAGRQLKETSRDDDAAQTRARKESTDAQSFTLAPLHVTETIVEREVETVRFPQPSERISTQRNQTPRTSQSAASPAIKPVVVQSISTGRYDEKRDGSLREQRAESGMPIEPRRTARKELLGPIAAARTLASVQSQPLVQNATPAEPTVQVTIGRVEVRATQQPSQTRATQRPASAKLSLEDYLKARGGGSR